MDSTLMPVQLLLLLHVDLFIEHILYCSALHWHTQKQWDQVRLICGQE